MQNTEFTKEQYDNIYPEGIENHYWNNARNRIILQQIKKNKLTKDKILEIGCGKGIVVEYLRKKSIDCYGVELADINIDKHLTPFVRSNTNAVSLSQEEKDTYQTVMLLDVIEHIEKPEEFLKSIKANYPNAKTFLITVPACSELWSNYDEYNGHFRRYDRKILESTIKQSGFTKIKLKFLFHSLYLPARILIKGNKKRSVELKAPKGLIKIIHKIISSYFYIESILLPNRIKGTSLISVVKTD